VILLANWQVVFIFLLSILPIQKLFFKKETDLFFRHVMGSLFGYPYGEKIRKQPGRICFKLSGILMI